MVERCWLASRIAAVVHLVAIAVLIAGNVVQVVRSAADSSRDLHGYVFLFSALFAVMLVIPLLVLIAARALIRRRLRAGLVVLGVYVVVAVLAVALTAGGQSTTVVAVIATLGVATLAIVVGTAIRSRSEQQRPATP